MRSALMVLCCLTMFACGGSKKPRRPAPAPLDVSAIVGDWDATCTAGAYVGSIEAFHVAPSGRLTGWVALGPVDAQLVDLGSGIFRASGAIVVTIDATTDTCTVTDGAGSSAWSLVAVALLSTG